MVNSNIKLLDCSLRDGGYVNNFEFGKNNISRIINGLYYSGTDIIELGFLKDGNHNPNQSLFNKVSEAEKYLEVPEYYGQEFCLMIRPDWYDISQLEKCTGKIKNIRFALRPSFLDLTLKQAKIARDYGYEVFLNPVGVTTYSSSELEKLLVAINEFKPKGVYIVDTFGSLLPNSLKSIYKIFNNVLDSDIAIGLHLHENLSIALALVNDFINLVDKSRQIYIDSSVLGIGRIPGNLCTETVMNFLNLTEGFNYNLNEIYKLIDNPISQIRKEVAWGYLPAYAITAFQQMHRSYAEYLMDKPNMNLQNINQILSQITLEKDRKIFNKSLIQSLYQQYENKSF